jgi:hypothetical protein
MTGCENCRRHRVVDGTYWCIILVFNYKVGYCIPKVNVLEGAVLCEGKNKGDCQDFVPYPSMKEERDWKGKI